MQNKTMLRRMTAKTKLSCMPNKKECMIAISQSAVSHYFFSVIWRSSWCRSRVSFLQLQLHIRHNDSVSSIILKCKLCLADFICWNLAHIHIQAYALLALYCTIQICVGRAQHWLHWLHHGIQQMLHSFLDPPLLEHKNDSMVLCFKADPSRIQTATI